MIINYYPEITTEDELYDIVWEKIYGEFENLPLPGLATVRGLLPVYLAFDHRGAAFTIVYGWYAK